MREEEEEHAMVQEGATETRAVCIFKVALRIVATNTFGLFVTSMIDPYE